MATWEVEKRACYLAVVHDYVDNPFLDEVHLGAHTPLLDDGVPWTPGSGGEGQATWLEHLILQLRHNLGNKRRVGVHEERHRGDQSTTVEVDHILSQTIRQLAKNGLFIKELALVSVLKVLCDFVSCVWWQFSISHVLLHLFSLKQINVFVISARITHFFPVLSPGGVEGLDKVS